MHNCEFPKEKKDDLQLLLNTMFKDHALQVTNHQAIGQIIAVLVLYFKPWFMEDRVPELPPAAKRMKIVKPTGYPVDPACHRFKKVLIEPVSLQCVLSVTVAPAGFIAEGFESFNK